MVVYLLKVRCELENVTTFKPPKGMCYCLDLQQSDGDEVREKVVVDPGELVPMKGGRGEANLTLTFGSKKEASVSFLDGLKGEAAARPYMEEDNGQFVTFAAFECRNCVPTKWHQLSELSCESTEGKKFDEVDLSEDDWCDYDDENDLSVSISNLESTFEVHRGK
ncbi:DUF866 domain-containing protein [Chloropicon primus]|uniref:DUF866 domain-containing protein n=1 Tax=Chloropicon primus TaxID=1764295 RepID=A0A5B8MJR4_9CHLO|nr:DUF866 domain-containing protein [Chloropicon primus]UPQ99861.1 DUF866 domain-containing protein [Chloropicon primus]|mmetsp:Transcript_7953/g.22777  ORF Transcript_7953/g.22777 Transcript_7953/m.22777 type:complete len:165 (-) Transcript_7953:1263-1757(-)|eukprot:QDZ20649.1 DUF866 domain-containing protein [Chloropicon primus]